MKKYIKSKISNANFCDSWALIYKHDSVILEKFNLESETFHNLTDKDIKEIRIFNKDDELKIWKYQGELKFRLFSENKHSEYIFKDTMLLNDSFNHLGSKIRIMNYYNFDENGLIRFYDARLAEVNNG